MVAISDTEVFFCQKGVPTYFQKGNIKEEGAMASYTNRHMD